MQVSLLPMVVDFSVLTDSIFALLLMITVSFQTCGFMKEVCFYEQEAYFYIRKFPFFCLNFLWLFVIFSCALIGHSSYLFKFYKTQLQSAPRYLHVSVRGTNQVTYPWWEILLAIIFFFSLPN